MQKTLIVANWKSNKTVSEALEWITQFNKSFTENPDKEIVLCVPFTLIYFLKKILEEQNNNIKLGGQDVSAFGEGAYTGEINSKQLKEVADYVIIGHSERRVNFREDDDTLFKKVKNAFNAGLTPIYCIQDETTPVPDEKVIIAYEPPSSISTFSQEAKADDPDKTEIIGNKITYAHDIAGFLYGGSVTPENVSEFTQKEVISGVLVGGKSLDPDEFIKIYENA